VTQTITFDEGIKGYILTALCLTVNKLGHICDSNKMPVPALDDETPVLIADFAGIVKTSKGLRLVRKDITSLIMLADYLEPDKVVGDGQVAEEKWAKGLMEALAAFEGAKVNQENIEAIRATVGTYMNGLIANGEVPYCPKFDVVADGSRVVIKWDQEDYSRVSRRFFGHRTDPDDIDYLLK